MKINSWNDQLILFSDGSTITYDYEQECCEVNYADFSVLEMFYNDEEFIDFTIEYAEDGFLLILLGVGLVPHAKKIFIPCYSEQNGYYSNNITVYAEHSDGSVDIMGVICEVVLV